MQRDDNEELNKGYIADYRVAKESVLRAIPKTYIDKVRNTLHIAYQHTSHGTHVSYGMYGLPDYKAGDASLFAISYNDQQSDKLDFNDNVIASYASPGEDASDLSRDEDAFIQATRNFLDDPENSNINVVMWSWCRIFEHDVEGTYIPGMQILINEYGPGGSKIGTGPGKTRTTPVIFIFMTGHAEAANNLGEGRPKNQAEIIVKYCQEHNYFCLDYYSIDTHDMDDNYWEDAGDNGDSASYGGNFYEDWQNSHSLGVDWYENRNMPSNYPGSYTTYGEHNSQHITANRKAYALWWILARIAGW